MNELKSFSAALTILLILHAQNHLRGAVVSGYHVWGHHEVSAGRPRQAEIQDLQSAVWLHNNVTGLQILRRQKIYKTPEKCENMTR